MSRFQVLGVALLVLAAFGAGLWCAARPSLALAQEKPPTPVVKPLGDNAPVVTAVPYISRTDYEQDPFDTTRVRRTTTVVNKILMVRADGTTTVRDAQ